jgi:hypothetical protein
MEFLDIVKQANEKLFNFQKDKNNNLEKNIHLDKIIFVYTPPKVGSTSLVSSIRMCAANQFCVIHLHDEIMLKVFTGIEGITINDIIAYNAFIGKSVYVIDIYRSPIERKISEYFEKLSAYHFNNSEENLNKYNVDLVIKRFNKIFPHLGSGDHYFEKYNIPIPDKFNHFKKFSLQLINGVYYLKLRLKDVNEWGTILTQILQTKIIIIEDYKTENKKLGDLYKMFLSKYKIPANYLDVIKDDKYLNYYYSQQEKLQYLNKWAMKTDSPERPYTWDEFKLYMEISLENSIYDVIQGDHYADGGCLCNRCNMKRLELFNKLLRGEKVTERINHTQLINHNQLANNNQWVEKNHDKIDFPLQTQNRKKFNINFKP